MSVQVDNGYLIVQFVFIGIKESDTPGTVQLSGNYYRYFGKAEFSKCFPAAPILLSFWY